MKKGGGKVWANGLPFDVAKAGMLPWVIIAYGTCDKCGVIPGYVCVVDE